MSHPADPALLATRAALRASLEPMFLLVKHTRGMYWAPNSEGYVASRGSAGRYTLEEARAKISYETAMIPLEAAPELAIDCDVCQPLRAGRAVIASTWTVPEAARTLLAALDPKSGTPLPQDALDALRSGQLRRGLTLLAEGT